MKRKVRYTIIVECEPSPTGTLADGLAERVSVAIAVNGLRRHNPIWNEVCGSLPA